MKKKTLKMMLLLCAAAGMARTNAGAQPAQKPRIGFQIDSIFDDDKDSSNPAWMRTRLNPLDPNGEFTFFDLARWDRRETPGGADERLGFGTTFETGDYAGYASLFGARTDGYGGMGFNFLGNSDDWVVGGVLEGTETPNGNEWLYGMQLGRRFETDFCRSQFVAGSYNLAGVETWTLLLFNQGPGNWDSGAGLKWDEEGNKRAAMSIGQHCPAFDGTDWRAYWETDFKGNHRTKLNIALDPHTNLRYSVYGLMNPNDGFSDVSLISNIMNFPDIHRHERARKFAFEFLYDNGVAGDVLSFGTSMYPLRLLGDKTSPLRPHIDSEWKRSGSQEIEYHRTGGGLLVDLTGSGRDSTTNMMDVGVFRDSEGVTMGYLQLVYNF